MTMKLTASMMVTVDGVYQGPGGPDEDRRGGGARAQGEARARAPGPWEWRPAPVAARPRPRRRAQPADLSRRGGRRAAAVSGARPDAQPGIGRIEIDADRRDAPDVSTRRAGDLRDRRLSDAGPPLGPTEGSRS